MLLALALREVVVEEELLAVVRRRLDLMWMRKWHACALSERVRSQTQPRPIVFDRRRVDVEPIVRRILLTVHREHDGALERLRLCELAAAGRVREIALLPMEYLHLLTSVASAFKKVMFLLWFSAEAGVVVLVDVGDVVDVPERVGDAVCCVGVEELLADVLVEAVLELCLPFVEPTFDD